MATVILLRHGRSTGNTSGVLSGRTEGVHLDDTGRTQVTALGERLARVPLVAVLSSPLVRCRETAAAVAARHPHLEVQEDPALQECDYGHWQGRAIAELAQEALWKTVQRHPSDVTFPGGESMLAMQFRTVQAIRAFDAAVEAEHGPHAVWAAVSHGDPIKSVLADAAGSHLDQFQRIRVDPASASVVRYTDERPYLLASNTTAGDLAWVATEPPAGDRVDGAVIGGGAGPEAPGEIATPRTSVG